MNYSNNFLASVAASRDSSMLAFRAFEYVSAALISLPAFTCTTNSLRSSESAKSLKLEFSRLSLMNLAMVSSDMSICSSVDYPRSTFNSLKGVELC